MNLRILLMAALLSNALWARSMVVPSADLRADEAALSACCCAPGSGSVEAACSMEGCTCHAAPAPDPSPSEPAPAPRAPDTLTAVLAGDVGVGLPAPMLDASAPRLLVASDRALPSHNETRALLGVWRT